MLWVIKLMNNLDRNAHHWNVTHIQCLWILRDKDLWLFIKVSEQKCKTPTQRPKPWRKRHILRQEISSWPFNSAGSFTLKKTNPVSFNGLYVPVSMRKPDEWNHPRVSRFNSKSTFPWTVSLTCYLQEEKKNISKLSSQWLRKVLHSRISPRWAWSKKQG